MLTGWLVRLLISLVIRTEAWHLCLLGKQGNTELNTETLQAMVLVYVVWFAVTLFLPAISCFLPLQEIRVMCARVSEGLSFGDALNVTVFCLLWFL